VVVTNEIPRVYEIERYNEKVVQVPQIVELEVNNPVMVKCNQIVESIIERAYEIPIIQEKIIEVPTIEEKIVAVERSNTEVREVIVNKDKIVEQQVFIERTNTINVIEGQLQVVDRYEEKVIPVFSTVEKIVEIPHILEKIVEKIVIMPQVVEVLKYVHEIVEEETLGIAVGVDIRVQEARYKELYGKVRIHFETILAELRRMKTSQPGLSMQIEIIEGFLIELEKLMNIARIVQVEKEKIVEREVNVPVLVPTKDSVSIRNDLSMSILVEKLIGELRRLKQSNPSMKFELDEDVQLIFFSELMDSRNKNLGEDLNKQLTSYRESMYNKLLSYGKSWSTDHEAMFNTVLQERFLMANTIKQANLEIERSKAISDQRAEAFKKVKQAYDNMSGKYGSLEKEWGDVLGSIGGDSKFSAQVSRISSSMGGFRDLLVSSFTDIKVDEPIMLLGEIHGSDGNFVRLQSAFRALEEENIVLRQKIVAIADKQPSIHGIQDRDMIIENLRNQIVNFTTEISNLKHATTSSVTVNVEGNKNLELQMKTLNSQNSELASKVRKLELELQNRENELIKSRATQSQSQAHSVSGMTPQGVTSVTSGVERMSESVHSTSSRNSGTGGVTSSYQSSEVRNQPSYTSTSQYSSSGTGYGTTSGTGYGTTSGTG